MPNHRPHLTPDQRATLAALIADRPGATAPYIAWLFRERTGRTIARSVVWNHRNSMVRGAEDQSRHLSIEHRRILRGLIRESAPDYCWTHTAQAFREMTGRPISVTCVRKFAVRHMGLSPITPDRQHRPTVISRSIPARLAEATAAQRARPPRREKMRGAKDKIEHKTVAGRWAGARTSDRE